MVYEMLELLVSGSLSRRNGSKESTWYEWLYTLGSIDMCSNLSYPDLGLPDTLVVSSIM
jgi:hypothetical protein